MYHVFYNSHACHILWLKEAVLIKKKMLTLLREVRSVKICFSDYIGFIKKALVLLKVYPVIKRVELEVQETEDPSPEESIPPISGSILKSYHI